MLLESLEYRDRKVGLGCEFNNQGIAHIIVSHGFAVAVSSRILASRRNPRTAPVPAKVGIGRITWRCAPRIDWCDRPARR